MSFTHRPMRIEDCEACVDLGVINQEITTAGFINPARYNDLTLHSDSPFKYFQDTLKSQVYSRVFRNGPDKDGKFDDDQQGRLVGNWFLDGLAVSDSANPDAWSQQMSFVYDVVNPTQVEIGIGGTVGVVGSFEVQSGAPDPAIVTQATGQVNTSFMSRRDMEIRPARPKPASWRCGWWGMTAWRWNSPPATPAPLWPLTATRNITSVDLVLKWGGGKSGL